MLVFLKSSEAGLQPRSLWARQGLAAGVTLSLACAFSLLAAVSFAEDQNQPDKKKPPKHRNTPLDTVMQTRLWADRPEPKDFVKERRPDESKLKYQPVTGTDPERPKLRTPAELKDLESELESARLQADKRGGIKPSSETSSASSKPKPASATE